MVWQGKIGLKSYVDTGLKLDAALTPTCWSRSSRPPSPLHDGAVIVSGGRIVAARCLLPLSRQETDDGASGTRHRAAMGLTEETDATVLVVSEETGQASVVLRRAHRPGGGPGRSRCRTGPFPSAAAGEGGAQGAARRVSVPEAAR